MTDPASIGIGISLLVKSAPHWFPSIRDKVLQVGKDEFTKQGKERAQFILDEKKHQRHVELALRNAAERGSRQWHTHEERDRYRSVLQILSERQSEALRQEAMQLFTLSGNPDLSTLTEKYNVSQRLIALAHHTIHAEVDAAPYLRSFFQAFMAELYSDPLFQAQISDAIQVHAAMQGTRSLQEICQTLEAIQEVLTKEYTWQDFWRELEEYLEYIEKRYRTHKFAGIVLKGNENKAPDLEHIFVPLHAMLTPRFDYSDDRYTMGLQAHTLRNPSSQEASHELMDLLDRYPYLILLGGPGSGKSTSTSYLTWLHAKKLQLMSGQNTSESFTTLAGNPLPLRIELRLFIEARRTNPEYSFLSYACQVLLGREHISVSNHLFEMLLERRALLVLFDGLDEVAALDERRQLTREIELFAQRYPGNRFLVTSRPIGYELASITDPTFQHSSILDFDDDQIHQFLESWYCYVLQLFPLPYEDRQELEQFFTTLKDNPRLHKLAINPLLLTVMTALHRYERLPDERVLIYDKCADLLLDTWARLKHEGRRWKEMKLGKGDQKACLAHLGFVLHQRSQELMKEGEIEQKKPSDTAVDVPVSFLQRELRLFLKEQNLLSGAEQHAEVERLLEMVQIEAGLIVSRGTGEDGEPLYGFVHRTFQEYFAALDIWNRYQQESDQSIIQDFLAEYVHEPHWREVILLLLGKLPHRFATKQLTSILGGNTRRSRYNDLLHQDLLFVARCLIDGIVVDQDFARDVITKLGHIAQVTPFLSQMDEVVNILLELCNTRSYSEQSQQVFLALQQSSHNLEWFIQLAQAIYQSSPEGSEEKREGARLLLARYQQEALPLEQAIQFAQAIYQYSPKGSEEKREGFNLLIKISNNPKVGIETRLELMLLPCKRFDNNFEERMQAIQILLIFTEKTTLGKLLEEKWLNPPILATFGQESSYEGFVQALPAISELVRLDIVPLRARNDLYRLLSEMVLLFSQLA